MNALVKTSQSEIMEAVIARGDIAKLSADERAKYYVRVCESVGLNPMTRPFEYITLNGKLTLYARKDCTDQLRSMHGVSVTDLTETEREGVFIVTAKVQNAQGRTDAAKGAVTISGLKGEALANALMKAETKAKRRATLSICGLGFLDETEIDDIPAEREVRPRGVPKHTVRDRTEVVWDEAGERAPTLADIDHEANEARAEEYGEVQGERLINAAGKWDTLSPVKQAAIRADDPRFWKYIAEVHDHPCSSADKAAAWIRQQCGVKSRAEFTTNEQAVTIWRDTDADFLAWLSTPAVLPAEHPAAPPPTATQGAAGTEPTESERIAELDKQLADAAEKGTAALQAVWKIIPKADRDLLTAAKDRRHKPRAAEVDANS